MYIKGTFERWHSETFESDNPMQETEIVETITKEDLLKAKNDDNYQVINILKMEFYNPKTNQWQKLKRR